MVAPWFEVVSSEAEWPEDIEADNCGFGMAGSFLQGCDLNQATEWAMAINAAKPTKLPTITIDQWVPMVLKTPPNNWARTREDTNTARDCCPTFRIVLTTI